MTDDPAMISPAVAHIEATKEFKRISYPYLNAPIGRCSPAIPLLGLGGIPLYSAVRVPYPDAQLKNRDCVKQTL